MKTERRMKMSKKTGMAKLRREKKRLKVQMELEKQEILIEVEKYKNSLWPFKIMARFRKTAESLSDNKLLVLAAQMIYSAINTAREKKDDDSKGGVKEFLKNLANNFLQNFINKDKEAEQ